MTQPEHRAEPGDGPAEARLRGGVDVSGPDGEAVPPWAVRYRAADHPPYAYAADAVVLGVAHESEPADLRVVLIERGRPGPYRGYRALPGGFVDWEGDPSARAAAIRELAEETGMPGDAVRYLEPLDTYDANGRDPRQYAGFRDPEAGWVTRGVRVVSKAFLALAPGASGSLRPEPGEDASRAVWVSVYDLLPWEDRRTPEGRDLAGELTRRLREWAAAEPRNARARPAAIEYAFGAGERAWNEERASERFALLREAGLVEESRRDRWGRRDPSAPPGPGIPLAFDHRAMVADALSRIRGKVKYLPVALTALVGRSPFTLLELRHVYEAVGGRPLERANFRRLVLSGADPLLHVAVDRLDPLPAFQGRGGRPPQGYAFLPGTRHRRLEPSLNLPWTDPGRGRATTPTIPGAAVREPRLLTGGTAMSRRARTALLAVDVQNDFCPGGALAVPEGDRVVPVLNRVRERLGIPLFASQDWHPDDTVHFRHWPSHCVQGTAGAALHPDLHADGAIRIWKGTDPADDGGYSAFDGTTEEGTPLAAALEARGVDHLVVGGLATDYCVRATVLDARERGFEVTVLTDAIAGIDLEDGDVARALDEMAGSGARLLDSERLLADLAADDLGRGSR